MLLTTYGSLRVGEYNHDRMVRQYGENAMHHLRSDTLYGFDLYDLGSFPTAVRGDNKLVTDTFEVTQDVYDRIASMEVGAGYYPIPITFTVASAPSVMYVMGTPHGTLVPSGDWSKHLLSRNELWQKQS